MRGLIRRIRGTLRRLCRGLRLVNLPANLVDSVVQIGDLVRIAVKVVRMIAARLLMPRRHLNLVIEEQRRLDLMFGIANLIEDRTANGVPRAANTLGLDRVEVEVTREIVSVSPPRLV